MKKLIYYPLVVLLTIAIVICLSTHPLAYKLSFDFARANPQIAYMQKPVLALILLTITFVVSGLLIFLLGILNVKIGGKENHLMARAIKASGYAFLLGAVSDFLILIYAYSQLSAEVGLLELYIGLARLFLLLIGIGLSSNGKEIEKNYSRKKSPSY